MNLKHKDKHFSKTLDIISNYIKNPKVNLNHLLSISPKHRPQAFFFLKTFDFINLKEFLKLIRNDPELHDAYILTGFQLGQINNSLYLASFLKKDFRGYLEQLFISNPFYLIPSIRKFLFNDIDSDRYQNSFNLKSSDELKSELGKVGEHSSRKKYLELFCLLELFLEDDDLLEFALTTQHQPFFEYLPFHCAFRLPKEKYINYILNNYAGLFTDIFVALYSYFPAFKGTISVDQALLNSIFRVFHI